MKKLPTSVLAIICLLVVSLSAAASDTALTLNKNAFLGILKTYHPVIRQADLKVQQARANVLQARGAFDPGIDLNLDRKTFDGNLYYSYFNPQVTIPTWYGIDLKAGVEEIAGNRINPESSAGKSAYIGMKIPVNNLFFDQRRAVLKQAQGLVQLSSAERSLIINDLIFEALSAYWTWVMEYRQYKILSDAVQVNEKRLRYLVMEYALGNRPAIDTVEAMTQLQYFYLEQNQSWWDFQNAGIELSNYMWMTGDIPFQWQSSILPDPGELSLRKEIPALDDLLNNAIINHPKLASLRIKNTILETDKTLKAQYLLPKFSVKGNVLSKGYSLPNALSASFLENNYKMGFDLSIPLFFRQARGAYKEAKIKIQDNMLEYDKTSREVQNKIKSYYNELLLLQQQLKSFEEMLDNNVKLFNGEKLRFDMGESTLFLLNARENKVLEIIRKQAELQAKWQKSFAALFWATGLVQ